MPLSYSFFFRKSRNFPDLVPFGHRYINFREDYHRRIINPLYFRDQNFSVDLAVPLLPGKDNQYLLTVDQIFLTNGEIEKKIMLKDILKSEKNCFLSFKKIVSLTSSVVNCRKIFENKLKKLVFSEYGDQILSINDKNNGFILSPPTFKFEQNSMSTFGIHYSFDGDNDQYITSFTYKDIFNLLNFREKRKLTLSELKDNNISIDRFTRIDIQIQTFLRSPNFRKKERFITVRQGGYRDVDYLQVPSRLIEFHSYKNTKTNQGNGLSRSFLINNKKISSKSYLLDSKGAVLKNSAYRLKSKNYKIGDHHRAINGRVLSSDYQRQSVQKYLNDSYEEAFLTFLEPDW